MHRAVLARRILVGHVLQVVGKDERRHTALAERDADRAVDEVTDLRRLRGLLHEGAGDVLEHAEKVDLLLVVAADGGPRLLPGDRQHRHVVEPRVVQAGDEMRGARAGGRHADAEIAGELGVGARHEGGHLLVSRLDELDLAVGAVERLDHPVDAVAGVAEDRAHAPGVQALDDEVSDGLGHPGALHEIGCGTRSRSRSLRDNARPRDLFLISRNRLDAEAPHNAGQFA